MEGVVLSLEEQHLTGGTKENVYSRPMSDARDHFFLSDTYCLVRQQLEVFVATAGDVDDRSVKGASNKKLIEVGSVGIRCVHCSRVSSKSLDASRETREESGELSGRASKKKGTYKGSVSYPRSIRLVYQAVRNWQRNHCLVCPNMPGDVKAKYLELMKSQTKKRSTMDSRSYWDKCLIQMGLVDTPRGIRLRSGVFELVPSDGTSHQIPNSGMLQSQRISMRNGTGQCIVGGESDHCSRAEDTVLAVQSFASDIPREEKPGNTAIDPLIFTADDNQENASPLVDGQSFSHDGRSIPAMLQSQLAGSSQHLMMDSFGSIDFGGAVPRSLTERLSTDSPSNDISACFVPEAPCSDDNLDFLGVAIAEIENSESTLDPCVVRGTSDPKATVLNRLSLAHEIVEAVGEIRQVPSACSPPGEDDSHKKGAYLLSLGIELYELFAGRHPFDDNEGSSSSDDSLSEQLRHPRKQRPQKRTTRVLRQYTPLSELLGLPVNLSDLVSDLLDGGNDGSAGAACTYGTVEEVRNDLHLMLTRPDQFLFGLDKSDQNMGTIQLNLSRETLHGRANECSKLMGVYHRVTFPMDGEASSGSNVVLVSGYSGTGKSTLVRKVLGQFIKMGACCVSGKFDAMRQVKPLSAIASALDEYCLMLARDAGRADQVRKAVSATLGEEGSILADLIMPNLREILSLPVRSGRRSSFSQSTFVSPDALQHRLSRLIRRLLCSTCTRSSPLVLFLDDLQWADESSLEIINAIITDVQIEGLLLVGSYRDNEVGPDHPLTLCLEGIRHSCGDVAVTAVHISNLDRESVNCLLSDSLHLLPRKTRSLADLVMQKTGGNALFVVELLNLLCDEGLLRFSLTNRRWEWDVDGIRSHDIADTVVDFVRAKLLRLAPEVHEALKIAAAFGAQCHEDVFKIVDKDPRRLIDTVAALDVAVSEGLLAKDEGSMYHFAHDQIQSAAYLLIPEPDRSAFHLQIGKSLWHHSSNEDIENYLFIVVDQLHRGSALISDNNERAELAQLSLLAGEKAFATSAFFPAKTYLNAGIGLLVDEDWQRYRDLCFDLFNLCAETEYILGDFEGMESHLDDVFHKAKPLREKLRAYYTLVRSLIAQGHATDAIDTALTVLAHLGEKFPSASSDKLVMQELAATQTLLSNKTEDELLHLEVMEDTEKKEAMKFLNIICSATYTENRAFFPLLISRMVRISLSHGVCNESATCFGGYGMILCGLLRDLDGGYRFGKLALATLEKFPSKDLVAWTNCAVHGFINNWKEPLQASLAPLKNAAEVGLVTGDTEYAMLSAHLYTGTALCTGYPLASLYEEMKTYSKQMLEYKQHYISSYNKPLRQATLNLLGRSGDPCKLVGEEMDENALLENAEGPENKAVPIAVTLFYRMWLEYLYGRYEDAAATAEKNKSLVIHIMSRFAVVCNHVFFDCLIALVLARKEGAAQYAGKIEKHIQQMEAWASSTPWNCQHKMELMKAEHAYLVGDFETAIQAYHLSAETASKHRFVHEEALALERTGIFYLETGGDDSTASEFFVRACDCYERWGAHSKASQVRQHYL